MERSRWQDPDWLSAAHAWIDDALAANGRSRAGAVEQPHVVPWSTVIKVPTSSGTTWFKANADSLRHEAALVELLAARRPDAVPALLASDLDRGWMLMEDAGETLRALAPREQSLDRWLDVLPLYAGVQLDLVGAVDELLALGVPDLRLAVLPDRYDRLMHEIGADARFCGAAGLVRDLCDEVAAYGIDETLQHDDLHDAQVFVRDGRHLLMDWGDSCISHPFFTLSVTLEGVLAWGLDDEAVSVDTAPFREAYLGPFRERYAGDLTAACVPAQRLGWVCRAVNGHVPGDEQSTFTRLRMFLDGEP